MIKFNLSFFKRAACITIILFSLPLSSFAYTIKTYQLQLCECKRAFSLVFFPLNYERQEVFLKDIEVVIQRLRGTKPFDEFISSMNLYYIEPGEGDDLILRKTQSFPPFNVRKNFLDDILIHLKSKYKLVIIDSLGSISCAELSTEDKMSLIILGRKRYKNCESFASGFLHELGHSLGLRDEGLEEEAELCSPGPPNCAPTKEEAEEWWGDMVKETTRVNYIKGCCGNKNYYRPTIASLMNDPDKAQDFGPVNERYLREVLQK